MECGHRLMKFILIGFNFLVLIVGGIAIGLGVWALTDDYGADDMEAITGSDLFESACIVVIVGGCVIVVISFLGCCGAWMENRCMLGMYFVIMLLFLILFVVGATIAFFYHDDLEDELEDEMEKTLKTKYAINTDSDSDNRAVTEVWDKIQKELHCCGVDGGISSETSWFMWQSSAWYKQTNPRPLNIRYVPASCCNVDTGSLDDCQKQASNSAEPPQSNNTQVTQENPYLYGTGCLDKLKDEIEEYVVAMAVVAVVALVILFCCVVFSVCICMAIGKKHEIV